MSLKRHSRDIILYKQSSLLLAPRALFTASAFCDIHRAPVLSSLHKCINPLPYQHDHRSSCCTGCSNDQASAVSRSILLSEKLISRETSELDAHDVHCQCNGSFSVVNYTRKPRCVERLRRSHAGLGEDDSTYLVSLLLRVGKTRLTINNPFRRGDWRQGSPQQTRNADAESNGNVETTLLGTVTIPCN